MQHKKHAVIRKSRPAAEPEYQRLFEAMPHPYLILKADEAFSITAVNDRYLAATGTTREALVGHPLFEIFPDNPNDATGTATSDLRASLERVKRERVPDIMGVQKYDIPLRDGSGGFEVRYWSPVNTPVLDTGGRVARIIHHVEDITEFVLSRERAAMAGAGKPGNDAARMEAEVLRRANEVKAANRQIKSAAEELAKREAELERLNARLKEVGSAKDTFIESISRDLRESEAGLKEAQRLARLGNWSWDVASNVHKWSEEIYLAYGRDPALPPAVYPDVKQYFTEESWNRLAASVEEGLAQGRAYECEAEVVRPDGTHRWIMARGKAQRDAAGNITRLYGTVQDITEHKRLEAELLALNADLEDKVAARTADLARLNEHLKDVDKLKSMFIASMSHELRTPLNSIIGFSKVLLNEWAGPVNGEQKENLSIISRAGKHLLGLINDMIDVSKIEAGKLELRLEDFDLGAVQKEVREMMEKEALERGLQFSMEIAHREMRADRQRLAQCLLNLVSNALKYTERGSVHVRTAPAPGGGGNGPGHLHIIVEDTGIGIGAKDRELLFSPFVRFNTHLYAKEKGTGLGLYLTKKLAIEVLNGDVLYEPRPEGGSRFILAIPERPDGGPASSNMQGH